LIQECFVQIDLTIGLVKLALAVALNWRALPWELHVNLRALLSAPAAGVFWTNAIPVPVVEYVPVLWSWGTSRPQSSPMPGCRLVSVQRPLEIVSVQTPD
jgi:hypothetical protein